MEEKKRIKLKNKVYTKNVTCFFVKDKWYPKDELDFNNYTKEYVIKGSIGDVFDIDSNSYIKSSHYAILTIYNQRIYICLSVIENSKEFIEDPRLSPGSGSYISIYDNSLRINTDKYKPEKKIYNISHYDIPIEKYTNIENKLEFIQNTFGFELETSSGEINKKYSALLGFANLYDGSISGVEYVSKPMKYNNLHHLHKFLLIAKACTNINTYCSLHIHIGNVSKSDTNLLSMYLLFQRLTDELNQLIVPYKKDINFLYNKIQSTGRDHCKNLPKLLERDTQEIYRLFKISGYTKTKLKEYIDGTNKWNIEGRYYTVNFMNYICKDINNTVEIRSLQSTYNFDYIITWLLINCAVIDYSIKFSTKVLASKEKIELNDCLDEYIKDKQLLSKVKSNILVLRNLFYNSYYGNNNSLTDLKNLEAVISSAITSYNIYPVDNKYKESYYEKYVNLKNRKANNLDDKNSNNSNSIDNSAVSTNYITSYDQIQPSARNRALRDTSFRNPFDNIYTFGNVQSQSSVSINADIDVQTVNDQVEENSDLPSNEEIRIFNEELTQEQHQDFNSRIRTLINPNSNFNFNPDVVDEKRARVQRLVMRQADGTLQINGSSNYYSVQSNLLIKYFLRFVDHAPNSLVVQTLNSSVSIDFLNLISSSQSNYIPAITEHYSSYLTNDEIKEVNMVLLYLCRGVRNRDINALRVNVLNISDFLFRDPISGKYFILLSHLLNEGGINNSNLFLAVTCNNYDTSDNFIIHYYAV